MTKWRPPTTWDDSNLRISWHDWVAAKRAKKARKLAHKRAAYEKGRPQREAAALQRKLAKMMRWG